MLPLGVRLCRLGTCKNIFHQSVFEQHHHLGAGRIVTDFYVVEVLVKV